MVVMMMKTKKLIGINHPQEDFVHGHQPAGQSEGEQREKGQESIGRETRTSSSLSQEATAERG
jgi:hypothetical protein